MFIITAYILNMVAVIMIIMVRILFEQDRKKITNSWTELDKNYWLGIDILQSNYLSFPVLSTRIFSLQIYAV